MSYTLGFCARTGSAAAVAVALGSGSAGFVGRWTVDLTQPDTPWQLYHAAAELPAARAETLVRAGVEAVTAVATSRMRELVGEIGAVAAVGVVTGEHPVPDTLSRILASHALMHAAEGQLYRDALLDAAGLCGLRAHGLPRSRAASLLAGDLAAAAAELGVAAGRPWRKEQKLAAVAALSVPDIEYARP